MKRVIILLVIFLGLAYWSSTFAQVTIDTATVQYNDNTTRIYGRATFVNTPSADEYKIGFLFGESYNDLNFIPMGSYSWNGTLKQLTFWTDLTNLEVDSKDYYTPYIQPKHQIRKFLVGGDGEDLICEPVIESASGTLRGSVGEQLTFSVTMEEREESCSYNYQWQYKLATEVEVYDTTSLEPLTIDTTLTYEYPENWNNIGTNSSEWTTPILNLNHNMALVRVVVSNTSGEAIKQGKIQVSE